MGTRRCWITIGVIVLVGVIGLIFAGYWFNWDWTGFNQHIGPRVPQYQPTKTLWDWLQLLIIPLVLAVAALLFNRATTRTEKKIALDKQREDLFQKYLDCMSDLMLKEKLRSSAVDSEVRNFARVRTITLLFQLDARRIGYVFAFLREAGLMSAKSNSSIVSLSQANLSKANLSETNLSEANLSGASLGGANLNCSNLSGANLSGAALSEANLRRANLRRANLRGGYLRKADLSRVLSGATLSDNVLIELHLSKADLIGTNLSGVDLRGKDLSGANLNFSNLSEANLTAPNLTKPTLNLANLRSANLSGANLSGAIVTDVQLEQARSLDLATMPDGSKHS